MPREAFSGDLTKAERVRMRKRERERERERERNSDSVDHSGGCFSLTRDKSPVQLSGAGQIHDINSSKVGLEWGESGRQAQNEGLRFSP